MATLYEVTPCAATFQVTCTQHERHSCSQQECSSFFSEYRQCWFGVKADFSLWWSILLDYFRATSSFYVFLWMFAWTHCKKLHAQSFKAVAVAFFFSSSLFFCLNTSCSSLKRIVWVHFGTLRGVAVLPSLEVMCHSLVVRVYLCNFSRAAETKINTFDR